MSAVERAFDDPRLRGLWVRLHHRYGASDAPVRRIRLEHDEERIAVAELLRSAHPPTANVAVHRLAAALGVDEVQLREVVEDHLGPAGDRGAERQVRVAARRVAADRLADAALRIDPALEAWARRQAVELDGRLEPQVDDALAILTIVATHRPIPVPLPVVAADRLGDPHGLDDDRRLGRMLVGALAARSGHRGTVPDARTRRRWLRGIGIVADELSSTVTVLRLPLVGSDGVVGTSGDTPVAVTLDQLVRRRLAAASTASPVHVVENPSVLSSAALAGLRASFVCTSGVPSVAALELLGQLRDHGVELRAHADFDAAGVAIVDRLVAAGARPWRMAPADYLAAPASAVALSRAPADVTWAPGLAAAMVERGAAVFEEQVLDTLFEDVGTPDLGGRPGGP